MQNQCIILDRISGSMWAAVLGDVIGSYLEFDCDITTIKIQQAFQINGGGKHHLQSGQPTDDSQLNYAICKALIRSKGQLNLNFIAQEMSNWYLSKPIDIGLTIRKSIPKACNMKQHQAYLIRKSAQQNSQQSQSNGSLMALNGLAIWCYKLQYKNIINAIKQYTILIHPNKIVIYCNCFYALMISYLLQYPQDPQRNKKAYYLTKDIFLKQFHNNNNNTSLIQFTKWLNIIQIIQDINELNKLIPINKNMGWIRIAFIYSCYYLLKKQKLKNAIKEIISFKGDTDTNACIIGGLLGVYWGRKQINMQQEILKISKWRPKKLKRPIWMIPGQILNKYINQLYKICPIKLILIGNSQQYYYQKNKIYNQKKIFL